MFITHYIIIIFITLYFCLDNSVLSVGKTFIFLSVLFILLHQDYIKFTARLPKGFIGITTVRLR